MFEFEQLFKGPDAVKRHLAAPLAPSRLAYLRYRAEQGARPSTLRGIAAAQLNAIRYLDLPREGKLTPSEIEDAAERWMAQDHARRGGTAPSIRTTFIAQVKGWLRFAGCLQDPSPPPRQYSAEVAMFTDYMRRERGWSEATVSLPSQPGGRFVAAVLQREALSLSDLTITTIDRALSEKRSEDGRSLCRATVRNRADALRVRPACR